MGLTLAHRLSREGASVTVIEQDSQPGGLATYYDFGSFVWDKYYHVILPTDAHLISLIDDIGLGEELQWRPSSAGYYVKKKFHPFSSMKDFLLFPGLGLWDKMRLGFTIYYGSKIKHWKRLEHVSVKDWLIRLGGKNAFEKFWEPLLLAKLGKNYEKVSAVFIWTYIKRLFEARESPAHKEHMGYVSGGYKTVFDRLVDLVTQKGSRVLLDTPVEGIQPRKEGGITLSYNGSTEDFDKVIFTAPLNVLEKVADPDLFHITNNRHHIDYLGVVCLALTTRVSLCPFYVLNLADPSLPFTGVIGMSSLVDLKETSDEHLTYFPKYITADHPYWGMSDEAIIELFMKGVRELYPDLKDSDIESVHLNRAWKVQPLQVLNYSLKIPKVQNGHPDFYVLNTSQFTRDTLNNNTVAKHIESFLAKHQDELTRSIPKPMKV